MHRYWPAKQPASIGTLVVEMTNEMVYDDYTMREIKLTNTKVSLGYHDVFVIMSVLFKSLAVFFEKVLKQNIIASDASTRVERVRELAKYKKY